MNDPRTPNAVRKADKSGVEQRAWLPLSAAQRMVWLDLRLEADPRVYQLTLRCRLNGALDLATARQALNLLAARHDALRLRVDPEQPRQWQAERAQLPLLVQVLETEEPAAVQARVCEVLAGVLPLGDTPLAQVDVLQLPPDAQGRPQCEWLWRVNHLVIDYAGLRTLAVQWVAVYNALLEEVPGELPRGSSFVATLAEEAAYAASPTAQADLAYWRQRFAAGVPELLFEPLSNLRGAGAAAAPPRLRWSVTGAEYAQWRAACTQVGITDQRALVGLLALALGTRYDLRELTLALALHGRDARTREVVGMMASVLLVRCQWQAEDTLKQALRAMAEQLDEDYRHQRTPVADISRALGAGTRGLGRLFDVSLSFVQAEESVPELRLGGAALTLVPADSPAIVPLPVLVAHRPAAQALDFELTCDTQFISADTLQSVAAAFRATVAQFCQRSSAGVADLEPASAEERNQLLHAFNPQSQAYPQAYPLEKMLHECVQAQVQATPTALAVVDGDVRLTYAELDAQSSTLARRIRHALRNVHTPEPVVAVALPRSAGTVVALLAILKAGAVYLPLDTAYPEQRLQYLLDDGQAALLIDEPDSTTAGLNAPRLTGGAELDLPGEEFPQPYPHPHPHRAQRLAYVIYTSGSTGQPKPVGVSHRAAVNLAYARRDGHDPLGAGDRVLAAISVGFDVSIGQLILPLLSGAAIVIAPPLRTLQAEDFWALLAEHQVTHINSVPSFFETVSEALVAMPQAQRYTGLKRLMLGGEALTGALARKLQQRLPGTTVVNMYGPTEACIDATAYVVPATGELPAALPIGKPLANYRAYVLDSLNRLCPIGVAGELCLAGAGLARGYLRRPEATAEKFTADPYAAEPGQRLYRTGDLARWTADGQIEFLGRNDQQVKIRGQRVETGEIEATLLQHESVQQAAVIARKDANGQARLLAYLVSGTDNSHEISAQTLKPWLAQRLPEHMVPAAFIWLPALPLTTNGKLDRQALPEPDALQASATPYVAPRDAQEAALQAAWQAVLGREAIGIHDDFFALGGHSLLALRLVSACQNALRERGENAAAERIGLRQLLARPTIADMAGVARQGAAGELPAALVGLRASGTQTPLFCVHPQSGSVWCFADLVRALPAGWPVWGLQAQGLNEGETPLQSVPAMAAVYLQALRAVQPQGPYRLLGYSSGGVAAFEMAAQLRAAGETVELLALLDSPLPDASNTHAATDAEVLADAGHLLGVQDPAQMPRNAAELLVLMQARGMVEAGQSAEAGLAQTQRLISTSRGIVQATRQHVATPIDVPAVQIRALQRQTPAADWQTLLAPGTLRTVDLDCGHIELIAPRHAAEVARVLAGLLN